MKIKINNYLRKVFSPDFILFAIGLSGLILSVFNSFNA